jgi:hypothetical protein
MLYFQMLAGWFNGSGVIDTSTETVLESGLCHPRNSSRQHLVSDLASK